MTTPAPHSISSAKPRPGLRQWLMTTAPRSRRQARLGRAYLAWLSGSFLGGMFADLLPVRIVDGMGIGLYALFIALLVPSARKHWQFALIAAASALTAWGLSRLAPGLSEGWALIAATLGGSALGTLLPDAETGS